jgi:hypothetical protein
MSLYDHTKRTQADVITQIIRRNNKKASGSVTGPQNK